MDKASCAGEFVRLPVGLARMRTLLFMNISISWPPFLTGEEISLTALPVLQTHFTQCIFEMPVTDLTYVPLHLLLCRCACRKGWHITNSRGGDLCLDATDDQYFARNSMPTTFYQYSVSGFKRVIY